MLERFDFPAEGAALRVDTGLRAGDTITPHYDPLLAKVMAHGATRAQATERLRAALSASQVAIAGKMGPKRSNLELMLGLLDHLERRKRAELPEDLRLIGHLEAFFDQAGQIRLRASEVAPPPRT